MNQSTLFVVDAAGHARNERLIGGMRASAVGLEQATAEQVSLHDAVVVDVDLTDLGNVRRLRQSLGAARGGQIRAFAVDQRRRVEMVHANILGATGLLRRPLSAARLERHLRREVSMPGDQNWGEAAGAGELGGPITSAAGALAGLFEALTLAGEADLPGLAAAGEDVTDAIAEHGLTRWLETVRSHHHGTFQHCLLVTGLVTSFAQSTGMSRRDTVLMTRAGLLHDIGKATIPVNLLDKPTKLTEAEMDIVRQHPASGFDYLAGQAGVSADLLAGVRSHHEYLDGSGYPDGLMAGAIGDVPRIMTICDIFGALVERRPYKPPMPVTAAADVLHDMAARGKVEAALVRALERAVAPLPASAI